MLIRVVWEVVFANTLWCLQACNLLEEVVDLEIFQDVGNTHDPTGTCTKDTNTNEVLYDWVAYK